MKKVVCLVLMLVLALLPMAIAETATVAPEATVEAANELEATATPEETEVPAEEDALVHCGDSGCSDRDGTGHQPFEEE